MTRIRRTALAWAVAGFLVSGALEAQDWRGRARVDGWVKDASGQPVVDAQVQLSREAKGGGPVSKTNKKGYWSVMGLIGGVWNVDISAPGFETRKLAVTLSEAARIPPIEVKLDKAAPAAPAAGEGVATGGAGPEIIAAIQDGNRLLGEKKYAEARALYEKALAAVPDNPAILKGIAQTYSGEGNKAKAIETLQKVTALDSTDTTSRLLLASLMLEQGNLDEGKAMLEALPEGSVTDSGVYANLGILFMNKKRTADAVTYLSKAVAIDPADADLYYYRGLAYMQEKKNAEAKADFNKYLELKPDGPEAKDVRDILQTLK